jgi:DNA-binding response OmpR family regulator
MLGMSADTPRVLVVEDEWLLRESTAAEFEDAGWAVLEASSAEEALALLQPREEIDALVTDIRLAGNMDGFELASVLRTAGYDMPVVYVSGSTRAPQRMTHHSVFCAKPVAPGSIIATTEAMVRRREGVGDAQESSEKTEVTRDRD